MKCIKIYVVFLFALSIIGCTKNNAEPIDVGGKDSVNIPSTKIISGEINPVATRVAVNDSTFVFDWSKSPTKTLSLYFKQNGGSQTGTGTATLNIDATGHCKFTATAPAWFNLNNDWVAGAIDATAGTATPEFNVAQPSTINASVNNIYLPMYFPLTQVQYGFVQVTFSSFGSVLCFDVANNLPTTAMTNYAPNSFNIISDAVGLGGKMTFASKTLGQAPDWVSNGINTHNLTISNLSLANGAKKRLYVWAKQNGTTSAQFMFNIKTTAQVNNVTSLKPARATLVDNKFYTIGMPANPELMITEVYEGVFTQIGGKSGMIELYNPGTAPIQLSNYYFNVQYTNSTRGTIQLPNISLPANSVVVLCTPGTTTSDRNRSTIAPYEVAGSDNIFGNPLSGDLRISLTKYTSDVSLTIDYIDCYTTNASGDWERVSSVLLPQASYNSSQWSFNLFGVTLGYR